MFGSRRIAARIFIGYLLPLIFFLALGLGLPWVLSNVLGQAMRDYTGTVRFVDDAYALRRSVLDSGNQLQGFLLYGDAAFREQFSTSRNDYRLRYRDMEEFVKRQDDNTLSSYLQLTDSAYKRWLQTKATPEFEAADRSLFKPRNAAVAQAAALRSARSFESVRTTMDRLVNTASQYREAQYQKARNSESWRSILTVITPLVAMLLAVIFGRYFTIGITQPIEALRLAAEEVERGDTTRLLLEDYPHGEDEIGDLGKALSRMARTIGERETVLRAQNEALAAIGRRIEAVLNATNDGIVLLDRGEGFSLVNARFAALFGVNPDDVLDQTFAQAGSLFLDRFRDKAVARERFREWISDLDGVVEETMEITEPSPKMLRIYTAPVRGEMVQNEEEDAESDIIGRIFVFRDVTRETIVDRMKTEFVSTVSHELRTPLTAIKGYVDLMIVGKTGPLNEVQSEFLTMVQASTRRLTDLINDMLDISRIESGRMTVRRETVVYLPLVRESLQMMANQAEAKNISLRLELPPGADTHMPPVRGDGDRITQVLVNLLSNAIKYTPVGGNVIVTVEPEGGIVTTSVSDTGIGINKEDQNRLFQKFFRADNSTTREVGGTGLGLAITKAILERMHGTIRVESESGKGSRFYFTLPVAEDKERVTGRVEPAPMLDRRVADRRSSPRMTQSVIVAPEAASQARGLLLITDEEPAILHRLSGVFRGRGFVTSGAMNYSEAARRARDLHPDAVLINLAATKLNVMGLLYTLRTQEETAGLPIFMIGLRKIATEIETRNGIVIESDSVPVEGSLVLTEADTVETLEKRLVEARSKRTGNTPVAVRLRLADFAPEDIRAESLAYSLQQQLIRGKGITLHIQDLESEGETSPGLFVSLSTPEMAGEFSPERIAEAVGNTLRQNESNVVFDSQTSKPAVEGAGVR